MRNNTRQPRELAKSLLDEAEVQIKDYSILFSHGSYTSAIRLIQSAIESIGKAEYCLSCNTTSIIKLNHEYQKIIPSLNSTISEIYGDNKDEKTVNFHRSVEFLKTVSKNAHDIIKKTKDIIDIENVDYDTFFEYYVSLKSGVTLPNGEQLLKIDTLFSIEKTNKEFKIILDDTNRIIDELDELLISYIINVINPSDEDVCAFCNFTRIGVPPRVKEVRLDSLQGRKIVKDFKEDTFSNITSTGLYYHYQRYISTAIYLTSILIYLNLLIQGHKLPATYPDTDHFPTKSPSQIYTKKHVLVSYLPDIYEATSRALEYANLNLESLELIEKVRTNEIKRKKQNQKKIRKG